MIKKIVIITAVIILVSALGVGIYDAYQGNSTFEVPNVQAMAAGLGQQQGMGPGQGQGQMQGRAGQQRRYLIRLPGDAHAGRQQTVLVAGAH